MHELNIIKPHQMILKTRHSKVLMIFLARRPCTKSPFHVWCKTQLPSCFAAGQLWVNFLSSLQKCNIKIVKIINLQFWGKKNWIRKQTWDSNFLQFWPFLIILTLDLIILTSFSVLCLSHEKEMKKVIDDFYLTILMLFLTIHIFFSEF